MDREQRHRALAERFLPDDLRERFRARAAVADRDNAFFDDDLVELRAQGYLTLLVPEELGGAGLSLHEVSRLQQRLAAAAPATALGINMHLLCTAVVRAMIARGDDSLAWVLDDAAAGEVFAFGISEPANDWVLQGSTTRAEAQDDGGWLLTGTKVFTSLSPVWTRLIAHGLDDSDPDAPHLVYGFVARDSDGITVSDHWDVLGMRASQSRTTRLDRARIRPEHVARRIPAGRHPDLLVFAITSAFQLLVASVYAGVAERALALAAEGLRRRTSAKSGTTLAEVPEHRARLADAYRAHLAVPAQLDAYTRDFDDLVDHGAGWPVRLVSARLAASDDARAAVETALVCAGGAAFDNGHELARLHRDVTASLFHPPSADAARPLFAAALLDG